MILYSDILSAIYGKIDMKEFNEYSEDSNKRKRKIRIIIKF